MASRIWLGNLYPLQGNMTKTRWEHALKWYRGVGKQVIIAKNNSIENVIAES